MNNNFTSNHHAHPSASTHPFQHPTIPQHSNIYGDVASTVHTTGGSAVISPRFSGAAAPPNPNNNNSNAIPPPPHAVYYRPAAKEKLTGEIIVENPGLALALTKYVEATGGWKSK